MALSYAGFSSVVLPKPQEHPDVRRDFQREMFEKKQNAEILGGEKKNWQIDWKIIDKLYHDPVSNAAAKFSADIVSKLQKDPKYINTPEYQRGLAEFRQVYDNAIISSKNIADQRRMKMAHPDAFVYENEVENKLAEEGNFNEWVKIRGGNPTYEVSTNTRPNVDENKLFEEVLKLGKSGDEIGKDYTIVGDQRVYTERPVYKEKDIAYITKSQWDASSALKAMYPNPMDYTMRQLDRVREFTKGGKQVMRKIDSDNSSSTNYNIGDGNNGRFAVAPIDNNGTQTTFKPKFNLPDASIKELIKTKGNQISVDKFISDYSSKGLGTKEELRIAAQYYTDPKFKIEYDAKSSGVEPKLTATNFESDFIITGKGLNIQHIASGENKKMNWSPKQGTAIDFKTGQRSKSSIINGELISILKGKGSSNGIKDGYYALIYDATKNKSTLIPYDEVRSEIKTYTVGKNGSKGVDLYDMGIINNPPSVDIKEKTDNNPQIDPALEWLNNNPNDPNAAKVREILKAKGVIKQ